MDKRKLLLAAFLFGLVFVVGLSFGFYLDPFLSEVISSCPWGENSDDNLQVHFLDVGKADCSYVKCGDVNILIDAGDLDIYAKSVQYLKRHNVKRLDLVIATHAHRDHIGQMCEVIGNFEIDNFIMSKIPETVSEPVPSIFGRMMNSLRKAEISITEARAGEKMRMEGLDLAILGPVRSYSRMNDNSVVVKLEYRETRFLFMGDAEKAAESDLIKRTVDLKADVLKVGHHGSKTSTSADFLSKVQPRFAVISVGKDRHNLPDKDVEEKLKSCGAEVFRTDVCGDVVFTTDGKDLNIQTETNGFGAVVGW